ncbi:flavodoxin [Intestinibacter bartlettii]|uniref:flavodoxin n=1 Tax=Intestinibacter bartlettii TaxID=261299 RepID=UPI00248CCA83|nr:flavodoxin [Intestinibacter bartlettii]
MKLKKIIYVVLLVIATMGILVGCSSNINTSQGSDSSQTSQSETDNKTSNSGKVLVVYYSASGNTEKIANMIADSSDADIFKIEPKEAYTDEDLDWTKTDSRVNREHDNENERDIELVSTTVDDWDSYDTVFIGYPIWWGIAAWPVNNFVENNDFSGKTVIPFCTSSSSGIGESGSLLAKMAGTGDWKEGQRFSSSESESDIQSWIEELGIN